ncbi:uncharacterized protein FMAN_02075 [Fusarium mangiferae]|uniref:Aminoglycoside phosphotransferase domain-containing protein n=1 Tax=Fusarium mangiferae TaxID=192010 RepID=A0A1L7SPR1_FUSMA|nr:uncharacterized protein FMAN_02075 [Fusarium mangiferae]CVK85176.1 uncharacterized protein FMAN_02075 [Fusarium mangiferae]
MARQILFGNQLHTLETAAESERNLLLLYTHQDAAEKFKLELWHQRQAIVNLIRHHLGLPESAICTVLPRESWLQGGFNICVLVDVKRADSSRKLIFRCPMPHKFAESYHPGSIDEKVSCEVATYVWMYEHCPDVRIPNLFAFGFTDSTSFVHIRHASVYTKLCRKAWKWIYRHLHLPLLSDYRQASAAPTVNTAYLLLEHIGPETGEMLSLTWPNYLSDIERRKNLFRGLARIMISLARVPLPHIGSFKFNPRSCTVSLSNRPLTCAMAIFEQSGTPRVIPPERCYQNTDSFASDMLTLHDNYLLHDSHAVRDEDDAQERMALRALLRTVTHFFVLPERRGGPYLLQPTDFHQSNIFVDDEWNITCLIDLEWFCSLPVEMLSVPYWLTGCSIDQIIREQYESFDKVRREFLASMDEELQKVTMKHDIQITEVIRDMWDSKGVWYWACIRSLNGWLFIVEDHIIPKFSAVQGLIKDLKQVSLFWQENSSHHIKAKVADEKRYQDELQSLFEYHKR